MDDTQHVQLDDDGNIRVAIVGSRNFPDQALVENYVRDLPGNVHVISGGAPGVDTWASTTARLRQLRVTVYPVDKKDLPADPGKRRFEYRRRAFARNREIVKDAFYVVAFWDTRSNGTRNAVKQARENGRPVLVILPNGTDPRRHRI